MRAQITPGGAVRRRVPILGVVLMLALVAGQTAVLAPPAGAWECVVKDVTTHVRYTNLQVAIDAAGLGDTLKIRGVCAGSFRIDKDLNLAGPATLDGEVCDGSVCSRGIVLTVDAGTVSLKNLTITNGSSTFDGGGIWNYGTLTLRAHTSVVGNLAEDNAGGVYNFGTLTMNSYSSVTGNSLVYVGNGGGIWNVGTLVLNGEASVSGNSATYGAGIHNEGLVILRGWDSSVQGNAGDQGGGIYNAGTVSMRCASSVTENTATEIGGGVLNAEGGTLSLRCTASITGNTAVSAGGGISNAGAVEFLPGWTGTVCGNVPDDWPGCDAS
jgi:hypothetical protein